MYRNAWWSNKDKCIYLRTWNENGERVTEKVPFSPYLYIETPRGQYESVLGTKLARKDFPTPFDRTLFLKSYGSDRVYEKFDAFHQFLLDKYWQHCSEPSFTRLPLRVLFYDIEVDPLPDGEFPTPEESKAEINLISFYDSLAKKYYIFSKNDYTGNGLGDDTEYVKCDNEQDLLRRMILFWQQDDYPDIVSAWNSNSFDLPYIKGRIEKVLGESEFLKLSPYGAIKESLATDKMGHEYTRFDIAGVANIDFIDAYIRFNQKRQESYRLDYIAHMELGVGKVEYESNIQDFMREDWNRFVEYNKRDVELLVKLEDKLNYFKIIRIFAYHACTNFEKALLTIPITNGVLAVKARSIGKKLHFFKNSLAKGDLTGGLVQSTSGFHHDIVTFDATSLYPSIIISNNISPETKIGVARPTTFSQDIYQGQDDDKFKITLVNGKEYEVTRKKLRKFVKSQNLVLCPNGAMFLQDQQGMLPSWVEGILNKRLAIRQEMKQKKKELRGLKSQLEYGINSSALGHPVRPDKP